MEEEQITGLIRLLDDCHTELTRADIKPDKYNDLSGRLIGAKLMLNAL